VDLTVWILFSAAVMSISAGLLWGHVRSWRSTQQETIEPRELAFRKRQFRRRMQTSSMLFLLGIAILAGYWIPRERPNLFVLYWCGVFVWTLWIVLLAVGDAVLSRLHLRAEQRLRQIDHLRTKAELDRTTAAKRNGKAGTPPHL
jgi:hypothetical protein